MPQRGVVKAPWREVERPVMAARVVAISAKEVAEMGRGGEVRLRGRSPLGKDEMLVLRAGG